MHTDGSIGRWPVIETDENNIITSIREYANGIPEMGHHFFESGLLVCTVHQSLKAPLKLHIHSTSQEEFISQIKKAFGLPFSEDPSSLIGHKACIYHISGFDINSFCAESVVVHQLA